MPGQFTKDQQLNKELINYFSKVLETPGLSLDAQTELRDAIKCLASLDPHSNTHHIQFPYPGESNYETADALRKIMNVFFEKYIAASPKQIKLQQLNFQRFLQESGLTQTSEKPTKRSGQ